MLSESAWLQQRKTAAWPDDERIVSLHHDAALRQDVALLAGVHDVPLLQHFEGKRPIGVIL